MAGLRLSLFHHIFVDPRGGFSEKDAGTKIQVNFPKAEEIAGGAFDTDSKELGTFKDADLAAQALLDQQSNNPHRPTNSGSGKGIGAEDGNPNGNSIGGH
ncbi:MAG TPA: hypothetical protein VMS82_12545 [Pseudolabrys sp.]|nr:hypothetical protein [Pseudolabrys sp.]